MNQQYEDITARKLLDSVLKGCEYGVGSSIGPERTAELIYSDFSRL